jgi:hypothetical protein
MKVIPSSCEWAMPYIFEMFDKRPLGVSEMYFCRSIVTRLDDELILKLFRHVIIIVINAAENMTKVDSFTTNLIRTFLVHHSGKTFAKEKLITPAQIQIAFERKDSDFVIKKLFQ